jgi:hypothetical protein
MTVDWKNVLSNYIALVVETEGVHHIANHNRHDGFTDEEWEALVEAAKDHPNGVL